MGCDCLQIGFPLEFGPIDVSEGSFDDIHNVCGIMTGKRSNRYFGENAASSGWLATWDFTEDTSIGYLYIARADYIAGLTQILLHGSPDNSTWTLVKTYNFFGPNAVSLTGQVKNAPFPGYGRTEQDFYDCFAPTAAFRYWRISIAVVPSTRFIFSKIYLGNHTDIGLPSSSMSETIENSKSKFRTTGGCLVQRAYDWTPTTIKLNYKGVPNDKAFTFIRKVEHYYNRFVILSTTQDALLNGYQVLHGVISDVRLERTTKDLNEISFTFTEMVG